MHCRIRVFSALFMALIGGNGGLIGAAVKKRIHLYTSPAQTVILNPVQLVGPGRRCYRFGRSLGRVRMAKKVTTKPPNARIQNPAAKSSSSRRLPSYSAPIRASAAAIASR